MVKNGVVAMLFWANGVIFLLFLLGITSEWTNVLGIFCLQGFVVRFSCNRSSCGLCNLCREVYIFCCLCNLLCCTKPQSYVWKFSVCREVYICCVDINVSVNVSLLCNCLCNL